MSRAKEKEGREGEEEKNVAAHTLRWVSLLEEFLFPKAVDLFQQKERGRYVARCFHKTFNFQFLLELPRQAGVINK